MNVPSQAAGTSSLFPLSFVPLVALFGLIVVTMLARSIVRHPLEDPAVLQITLTIHRGATTFLAREYALLFPILVAVGILLSLGNGLVAGIAFLVGSGFSVLAGYIGMHIATQANGRTTVAARRSLGDALNMAFSGGSVMVGGKDMVRLSERERQAIRGTDVAYVPQSAAAAFNPASTIMDQVIEVTRIHGLMPDAEARIRAGHQAGARCRISSPP